MNTKTQKIYAGTQLRELRGQLRLTQREFATRLGVSVSYLNQMENNNRPIAAAVILTLAREFKFDISELASGDSIRLVADLQEVTADPLFSNVPSHADLNLISTNAPNMARAFLDLYRAYRTQQERMISFEQALGTSAGNPHPQPWEEVRDFFHYCNNYIDAIDCAAESFAEKIEQTGQKRRDLLDWFAGKGIEVKATTQSPLRKYNVDECILEVSANVEPPTQLFQMAVQIAFLEYDELLEVSMDLGNFRSEEARKICKIGLANYFAGALMMPYQLFLDVARELRHDLEALALHFEASIEQVSHRLSTMQRPGNKGIPFFFVRVDQAGTITKRHSAARLQFARFGGACPLWNVHRAFETPGHFLRQLAETPDEVRYFCLARDVSKSGGSFRAPTRRYAIGLGCEIEHVKHLVYADDLDINNPAVFEPIGVSCRICSRNLCHQRAVPPLDQALTINPNSRDLLPYAL